LAFHKNFVRDASDIVTKGIYTPYCNNIVLCIINDGLGAYPPSHSRAIVFAILSYAINKVMYLRIALVVPSFVFVWGLGIRNIGVVKMLEGRRKKSSSEESMP
jgi:hypothetical protein